MERVNGESGRQEFYLREERCYIKSEFHDAWLVTVNYWWASTHCETCRGYGES